MGSHHKRNEGLKPIRRTAAKPKPESRPKEINRDARGLARLNHQQALLDTLVDCFVPILNDPLYTEKLQSIKGHFFKREYAKVFEDPESCRVYSTRYLPSRALAYAELFGQQPILDLLYPEPPPRRPSERHAPVVSSARRKVVAVGAGVGSEVAAMHLLNRMQRAGLDADEDYLGILDQTMDIDIVDYADYSDFLSTLNNHLDGSFQKVDQAAGGGVDSSRLRLKYHRRDVLQWSQSTEFASLLSATTLLTFMFVFNELFAASKLLAVQLISVIAKHLSIGSHVLLIESAGDLSQVKIQGAPASGTSARFAAGADEADQKGLMVYKFWDHLPGFEIVLSEDRRWHRIDPALRYPLEMENVGYFVRLYRKIC